MTLMQSCLNLPRPLAVTGHMPHALINSAEPRLDVKAARGPNRCPRGNKHITSHAHPGSGLDAHILAHDLHPQCLHQCVVSYDRDAQESCCSACVIVQLVQQLIFSFSSIYNIHPCPQIWESLGCRDFILSENYWSAADDKSVILNKASEMTVAIKKQTSDGLIRLYC